MPAPKISAPGIAGTYREDFLYSAGGVPMEGTGTAASGAHVHYAGTHGGYWVTKAGVKTDPGRAAGRKARPIGATVAGATRRAG